MPQTVRVCIFCVFPSSDRPCLPFETPYSTFDLGRAPLPWNTLPLRPARTRLGPKTWSGEEARTVCPELRGQHGGRAGPGRATQVLGLAAMLMRDWREVRAAPLPPSSALPRTSPALTVAQAQRSTAPSSDGLWSREPSGDSGRPADTTRHDTTRHDSGGPLDWAGYLWWVMYSSFQSAQFCVTSKSSSHGARRFMAY